MFLDSFNLFENWVELIFAHSNGLHIKGQKLEDLRLYSFDKEILPIDVSVKDNKLIILLENGVNVTRIDLGYCNAPEHNLYNDDDYLASPFSLKLN